MGNNDGIGISTEGAEAFVEVLKTNTTLIKLDLWYGNLSGNIMVTIDKCLHRNITEQKEKTLSTYNDTNDEVIEKSNADNDKDKPALIGMQEYFIE